MEGPKTAHNSFGCSSRFSSIQDAHFGYQPLPRKCSVSTRTELHSLFRETQRFTVFQKRKTGLQWREESCLKREESCLKVRRDLFRKSVGEVALIRYCSTLSNRVSGISRLGPSFEPS